MSEENNGEVKKYSLDAEETFTGEESGGGGAEIDVKVPESFKEVEKELRGKDWKEGLSKEEVKDFQEQMDSDAQAMEDMNNQRQKRRLEDAEREIVGRDLAQAQVDQKLSEQEQAAETIASLADRWRTFVESYKDRKNGTYPYFEQIQQMRGKPMLGGHIGTTVFVLNYEDLATDEGENFILIDKLIGSYDEAIAALKVAIYDSLVRTQPEYADYLKEKLIVQVKNSPYYSEISNLVNGDIDKLRRVNGIVTQFDNERQIRIVENVYMCEKGHLTRIVEENFRPTKCATLDGTTNAQGRLIACGARITKERTDLQKRVDQCYIRIQERQDRIRDSAKIDPMFIDIYFEGEEFVLNVMRTVSPGQLVEIDGVVRLSHYEKQLNNATINIQGSSYVVLPESMLIEDDPMYDNLVKQEIPLGEMRDHFDKMVRSYAPHLQGLDMEKKALLAQAVGSDAKQIRGGARFRGDLNIALIGSSATGKTELLKFQEKIRPGSIYVSGRGASAIGLTAGIEVVQVMRGGQQVGTKRVSCGAYTLAKNAIVCLDELEKRNDQDYESLSHPMDDLQEISVMKHGIFKRMSASCGSLHAGNPKTNGGVYDRTKPFFDQINFGMWLYSRYDLIFITVDEWNDFSREKLFDHISDSYATVRLERDVPQGNIRDEGKIKKVEVNPNDPTYPWQYLRREIIYLREHYHPVLVPHSAAWQIMVKFWKRFNQVNMAPAIDPDNQSSTNGIVPALDKRKINGIIRTAEAIARLWRSNTVEVEHMDQAINLFKYSVQSLIPTKTDGYANPTLVQAKLSKTMLDHASKQYKKGVTEYIREYRQGLIKFTKWLHHTIWDRCTVCKGSKQEKYLTSEMDHAYAYRPCTECSGTGGQYKPFTFQDCNRIPREIGVRPQQISDYFNWLVSTGALKSIGKMQFIPTLDLSKKEVFGRVDSEMFVEDAEAANALRQYESEFVIHPPKNEDERRVWDESIEDLKKLDRGNDDIA